MTTKQKVMSSFANLKNNLKELCKEKEGKEIECRTEAGWIKKELQIIDLICTKTFFIYQKVDQEKRNIDAMIKNAEGGR